MFIMVIAVAAPHGKFVMRHLCSLEFVTEDSLVEGQKRLSRAGLKTFQLESQDFSWRVKNRDSR